MAAPQRGPVITQRADSAGQVHAVPRWAFWLQQSWAGAELLARLMKAFPSAKRRVPGLRMIAVAGPRIDPTSLPRHPGLEIWAAGFSFGSYVALTAGARDDRVCALAGIAPPVDRYDYTEVKRSTKPKFIIHGAEDELIPLKKVREFYAQLQEPKELVVIDRANHLFDGQTREVGDALEDLLGDFSCTKL